MRLELRDENETRIDIIELNDGCYPSISLDIGSSIHETATESEVRDVNSECQCRDIKRPQAPKEEYFVTSLEPAVWTIIPILDKICVDCQKRRVTWSTREEERQNEAAEGGM